MKKALRLPFNAIQAALVTRLGDGVLDLASAAVPVYDHVPEGEDWKYIKVGPYESLVEQSHQHYRVQADFEIHAYSDYNGSRELNEIMDSIARRLRPAIKFDSANFVDSSDGGETRSVKLEEVDVGEGFIVRHGVIVHRWTISVT